MVLRFTGLRGAIPAMLVASVLFAALPFETPYCRGCRVEGGLVPKPALVPPAPTAALSSPQAGPRQERRRLR